jgi:polyisoprenoid-binding protein YceI
MSIDSVKEGKTMRNFSAALIFLFLSSKSMAAGERSLLFDLHDSKVDFLSVGRPSAIKIRGEGSKLEGKMTLDGQIASGRLIFDLDSLDTDISLRNKHMKEKYLETGKFKNAELTIEKMNVPPQLYEADAKPIAVPFSGVLSLHGVQHPISGTSEVRMNKNAMTGTADFEIKLSDYKIEIPSYMGITVADVVKVSVNFAANGKPSRE